MLEDIDARIANELAADGRCSYTDLAERVGLSVSAVHQRVRRLEQRGVIRGYAARIGGEEIGLPLTAFVSLTPIDPAAADDYPSRLAHLRAGRGLLLRRGRRVLHPQGAGGDAGRPRGTAGPDPGGRARLDPHHRRAVDTVRGPSAVGGDAELTGYGARPTAPPSALVPQAALPA